MTLTRDNIYFILVRTQFASNLGSTVRVMKNMGFENLILVQPECEVGMEARSFAMKGSDILDRAVFAGVGRRPQLLVRAVPPRPTPSQRNATLRPRPLAAAGRRVGIVGGG